MKLSALVLCMAAAVAAQGQTASNPATAAKTATAKAGTAVKSAATITKSTASHATSSLHGPKLPPGIPPARGVVKTALALTYQDIVVGKGPEGEPNKIWHVKYTGWRAADGVKFDSWDEHKPPLIKDGKPETGTDGKPVLGDPKPLEFPHGVGRMIPGFDTGIDGMHVGGKRRIFVPWQLAYGARAIPDRDPDHPGIPAKSDLIFDVELVEVSELPPPPARPMRPSTQPIAPPAQHFPTPAPGSPATAPAPATPPPAAVPAAPAQPKPATPPTK